MGDEMIGVRPGQSSPILTRLFEQPHLSLLLFQPLDLSLNNIPDKCGATLLSYEVVDSFTHAFRQANNRRFHF